jgi:8-oxo-dGTP diphosphatase
MMRARYVAGLFFSNDMTKVALIKKERPAWQKDRFNAIGGHIEDGETPEQAMRREFREEAGVDIIEQYWELVVKMDGSDWELYFYRTWGKPEDCVTQTDEEIFVFDVKEVKLMRRPYFVGNLSWLVPLCLDISGGVQLPVKVNYKDEPSDQVHTLT